MAERERRVLEAHRESLVSGITDVEPILDHLVSTNVFRASDDNVQRIRAGETARMRARRLLDILQTCGRSAFEHFVQALSKISHQLAENLQVSLAAHNVEYLNDLPNPRGPSLPAHSLAQKLQRALRAHHLNAAERTPLLDFQSSAQAVGLKEVFVTLSALSFGDTQASSVTVRRPFPPSRCWSRLQRHGARGRSMWWRSPISNGYCGFRTDERQRLPCCLPGQLEERHSHF